MCGSLFSFISFWNELASAYSLLGVWLISLFSPVYLILNIYRNCKKKKRKKLCTFDLKKKLVILHRHIYFIYLVKFLLLFSTESELLLTKTCHTWETVSKYFTIKIRLIGWNSGSLPLKCYCTHVEWHMFKVVHCSIFL